MNNKLTKEEQIIKFFNTEYANSNTNEVSISRKDVQNLGLSEKEASRIIHLLKEEDLLHIKQKSNHNDFSVFWKVALMPQCVHYFENKKVNKRTKIINFLKEFRAWDTLVIALIALIHSIYTTDSKNVSSYSSDLEVSPSVSNNQVHTP